MTKKAKHPFHLGQEVVLRKTHFRGIPERGTVVKIGRTLAHVEDQFGRVEQYRLADGRLNSMYSGSIETVEQHEASIRYTKAVDELRNLGVSIQHGHKFPIEVLDDILAVLR